jgi:hypothetical protein
MLAVVQLHDPAADVRLEGAEVVGQIGKSISRHPEFSRRSAREAPER